MSTPATSSPTTRAACTAASTYAGASSMGCPSPPRWMLERNSPFFALRRMAPTTRSPTTSARTSRPSRLGDELLEDDFLTQVPEGVEDGLHLRHAWRRSSRPRPGCPRRSLMMAGSPPTSSTSRGTLLAVARHHRAGDVADPKRASSCRQRSLSRLRAMACAVLRAGTPIMSKLVHHREPVAGDGGADAGDDHVHAAHLDAAEHHPRRARGQHQVAAQGVQHERAVAARLDGLHQPAGGVQGALAGEDGHHPAPGRPAAPGRATVPRLRSLSPRRGHGGPRTLAPPGEERFARRDGGC